MFERVKDLARRKMLPLGVAVSNAEDGEDISDGREQDPRGKWYHIQVRAQWATLKAVARAAAQACMRKRAPRLKQRLRDLENVAVCSARPRRGPVAQS